MERHLEDRDLYWVTVLDFCTKNILALQMHVTIHMTVIYLNWKKCLLVIKHTYLETVVLMEIKGVIREKENFDTELN